MAQKTDPQDILLVKNIDENCSEVSNDVVRTSRRFQDPETGQWYNEYIEVPEEWNHSGFYQVKWSSQPHRIAPGQTKLMPRYIAEHFAKNLATHMLDKMEKVTGRKGLVQSNVERPKMLRQILLSVETYHLSDSNADEGVRAVEEVNALNAGERAQDLGDIPNPAVGILQPEPLSEEQILANAAKADGSSSTETTLPPQPAPTTVPDGATQPKISQTSEELKASLFDKDKPLPLKKDLLKTAFELGLDITGTESSEKLAGMIRAF